MSIALDVLSEMIIRQASARLGEAEGANYGASIYLNALLEAQRQIIRAEIKALEAE